MSVLFFFNDTAPTEIYTLSLHDALPIYEAAGSKGDKAAEPRTPGADEPPGHQPRSEEHTSELQSRFDLVCRLLLEKKNGLSSARPTTRPTAPPRHSHTGLSLSTLPPP